MLGPILPPNFWSCRGVEHMDLGIGSHCNSYFEFCSLETRIFFWASVSLSVKSKAWALVEGLFAQ